MKERVFLLLSISVLVAALLGTTAYGEGVRTGNGFVTWEYGELLIQGEKATFVTENEMHELDPPARRVYPGSSGRTDWGRIHYQTSVKLLQMNRLGQDGWELVSTAAIQDGIAYMVRRPRR